MNLTEPRPCLSAALLRRLSDRYALCPVSEPNDLGGSYSLNLRLDTAARQDVARLHVPWLTLSCDGRSVSGTEPA